MVNVFTSSLHQFTSPIRLFKENDPYVWFVDNIPLSELEQNTLWLRDQIQNLQVNPGEITRREFGDLKPYVTDADNLVRVKKGNYIARINDAYNRTPHQRLAVILGDLTNSTGNQLVDSFNNDSWASVSGTENLISKLQSGVAASATFMNGLGDRLFSWPSLTANLAGSTVTVEGLPGVNVLQNGNAGGLLAPLMTSPSFMKTLQGTVNFKELPRIETEFIKHWRGVARTAVVDVPTEVTVEVDAFDEDDFFYVDSAGNKITIPGAATRIDLVFLYSKPIDASSTTIQNWSGGSPQNITTPVVGVLKGAGLGISQAAIDALPQEQQQVGFVGNSEGIVPKDTIVSQPQAKGHQTADGLKMLANVGDQFNSNIGFSDLNIHGSFPSPDDLLNLAPNMMYNLADNDPQLIGQTVLPLCYVVVNSTAGTNLAGKPVITEADIIDIRPFFRTTEMTYSERAGIAAATPKPSIYNAFVTEQGMKDEMIRNNQALISDLKNDPSITSPRVIAGGIIYGGKAYGPEGAIDNVLSGLSTGGFSSPFPNAPLAPDWDLADWWSIYPNLVDATTGSKRNDWINHYFSFLGNGFDGGSPGADSLNPIADFNLIGTNDNVSFNKGIGTNVLWCKKEIILDKTLVPWMSTYSVHAEFENCIPQTSLSNDGNHFTTGSFQGIWVEIKPDRFIIYAAWTSNDGWNNNNKSSLYGIEPRLDRDTYAYSGFISRWKEMGNGVNNHNPGSGLAGSAPRLAACTYPTVRFKVVGYPLGQFNSSLNSDAPTLVLK